MAFPFTRLDLTAQLYYSGAWQTITRDVLGRDAGPIRITRGRSSEGAQSAPTSMSLQLLNSRSKVNAGIVGRYSPRNVDSDLYGLIGRNTPIRVYAGTEHVGAGSGSETASTTHTAPAATATAAGVAVRAWLAGSTGNYGTPASLTTAGESDGSYSALLAGLETVAIGIAVGTLAATFSSSQAYASATAVVHGSSIVVRESLSDVSATCDDVELTTGAATEAGWWLVAVQGWSRGVDVEMPDAPAGDHGGWILLADSGIYGESGAVPSYQHVRVWARRVSVAGAQTVIFTGVAEADSINADNHAHLYVLSGVDDWDIRATCEVPAWPARWDISGQDVWVSLDAAGVTRRLGQGAAPLKSALRRALTGVNVTVQAGVSLLPVCYWPLEDAVGSTQAASGLPGGQPMTLDTGTIEWASVSSPGSAPLPDLRQSTGILSGPVTGISGSSWAVRFLIQYTDSTTWQPVVVECARHPYTRLRIDAASGITVTGITSTGSTSSVVSGGSVSDGDPHWVEIWATDLSGSVQYELWIDGTQITTASVSGTLGVPSEVRVQYRGTGDSATVGHVGVWDTPVSSTWTYITGPALDGHAGEVAGRRMERLCREEGIAFYPVGDLDDTAAMGAQSVATLLALLRECEDADGGILYEPREALGLAYRCRTARYNQAVTLALDYGLGEIAPPLEPVDDDRYTRNDVTAYRTGGSSARYEVTSGALSVSSPPDGVGRYDDSVTVNVELDTQLADQASWRAHLGTVDEERYPTVRVNLARLGKDGKSSLARTAAAVDVGDRLTITGTPAWMPPDDVDQQCEGVTEVLGQHVRDLYLVCVPNSPWRVGVVEDDDLGRADTDGSELVSAVTSSATSLSVVPTTDGEVWINSTDSASMFPFDVGMGGERLTVTACASSCTDAFGRTVSSGWGSADTGQAWTTAGGSASDFNVAAGVGTVAVNAVDSTRQCISAQSFADGDVKVQLKTGVLATGNFIGFSIMLRRSGGTNYLYAEARFNTDQSISLYLQKLVGGSTTVLASATVPHLTHAAATYYWIRARVVGNSFYGKIWQAGRAEPAGWTLVADGSAITASNPWGLRSVLGPGNTNALPVTITVDNLTVLAPQTMTVTRSVNGVSKSHDAGTSLSLWTPWRAAL